MREHLAQSDYEYTMAKCWTDDDRESSTLTATSPGNMEICRNMWTVVCYVYVCPVVGMLEAA